MVSLEKNATLVGLIEMANRTHESIEMDGPIVQLRRNPFSPESAPLEMLAVMRDGYRMDDEEMAEWKFAFSHSELYIL